MFVISDQTAAPIGTKLGLHISLDPGCVLVKARSAGAKALGVRPAANAKGVRMEDRFSLEDGITASL